MLAYARICCPMSMEYRSSETSFQYGYRHKCIYGSNSQTIQKNAYLFGSWFGTPAVIRGSHFDDDHLYSARFSALLSRLTALA